MTLWLWRAHPTVQAGTPASARSLDGWEIRYNATVALARRGSPHVRLEILREMLDEGRQRRNRRGTPDAAAAARRPVLSALKALRQWHEHPEAVKGAGQANSELYLLYQAVDRLAESADPAVSTEAKDTLKALKKA